MDHKERLKQQMKTSYYAANLIERAVKHMTDDDRDAAIEILKATKGQPQILREPKPRKRATEPQQG